MRKHTPALCITLLATLLLSSKAAAHVRWFVEDAATEVAAFTWSPIYFLILIASAAFCATCLSLNKIESKVVQLNPLILGMWPLNGQWRLLSVSVGICFLINTLSDTFIAPNLPTLTSLSAMQVSQLVCALVLMSGLLKPAAVALLLTMLLGLVFAPLPLWIDYGPEFIGIALCLWYYKRPSTSLSWLRLGLGIQLIILAIHNKLASPELGLEFLSIYSWNFVQLLGFEGFNDLEFVFCAGMAELCFGIAITLGWSTRLVTFITLSFFVLTSFLLGIHELIGHLPIVGIGLMLITLGGGNKLPWGNSRTEKAVQEISGTDEPVGGDRVIGS